MERVEPPSQEKPSSPNLLWTVVGLVKGGKNQAQFWTLARNSNELILFDTVWSVPSPRSVCPRSCKATVSLYPSTMTFCREGNTLLYGGTSAE